jgi:hypothetical protein
MKNMTEKKMYECPRRYSSHPPLPQSPFGNWTTATVVGKMGVKRIVTEKKGWNFNKRKKVQERDNTFGYDSNSTLRANEQFHGIETSGGPS